MENKAFRQVDANLQLALLPLHMEYPLNAVKEQLNNMLFRYWDDLQGVPILYTRIHFPPGKECGRIMGELPWIHVDANISLIVFQPRIGQLLHGKINKVYVSENT